MNPTGPFKRIDYHIHSEHSPDGFESLAAICRAAEEKGFHEIAITDHVDFYRGEPPREKYGQEYVRKYVEKVERFKETYEGPVAMRLGVELGQPHEDLEGMKRILDQGPFDFVIASLHGVDDIDYSERRYDASNIDALTRRYFESMYGMVAKADYDVVGHMDYIRRYIWRSGQDVDVMKYEPEIRDVLKEIIRRGKGIEINGSAGGQREKATFPCKEIVRLFVELGGSKITFGSDAHRAIHIGNGFETAREIAEELGLKGFARYEKRRCLSGVGGQAEPGGDDTYGRY
ncbi:histidinol-phosphatase HisJ family protein [Anaerotalea alkaliphila]|uniref:Histidinol-phosphatase n=1 Tax=Anaerotalea alkaliphila TaxID=2662126 RepID=A0A7X5HVP6_9FIRM|nr:histidinol-phosphatase HisJ family protein [Anaerotalea alkaliphila]NDL67520.1 histidinol-phosphatase HisJ family protein [Anaerotalea alkaliphila]